MTNGEKIKELYPRTPTGVRLDVDGSNGTMTFTVTRDWWNAEYKEPTTKNDLEYSIEPLNHPKNDLVTLTFSKGTLKYSCKDYVVYKKDWLRNHYGAEIDIMFGDSQYKEPTTKNDLIEMLKLDRNCDEPRGHWIANVPQYDILNPQYFCSECGNAHTRTTPYCEMCGAKMV